MENENGGSIQRWAKAIGFFSVLLAELIGSIGAGVGVGYLLWNKLGAPALVMLPTTLLGLGLSAYRLYRFWQTHERNGPENS